MALRMARPMRRKESSFHQLRARIPRDVLHKARGSTLALPIGADVRRITISPRAEVVAVSLRSRDPNEVKARQTIALAYLDSYWQSLRSGPVSLTQKQLVALAGDVYRDLTALFEDNPGTSTTWEDIIRLHTAKMAADPVEMNEWLGPTVDEVLARRRLIVDTQSRDALLIKVGVALVQAADRLRENALGDYSPDEVVRRFPAFEGPKEKPSNVVAGGPAQTVTGLVDGWWLEAKAGGGALNSLEVYRRVAKQFAEFLGHDDAHAVTDDDVIRYKDHRLAGGISVKTISDTDLSGLRTLFNWGVRNKKVRNNPALEVRIRAPKKARVRGPEIRDDEAIAVLSHAWHQKRGREMEQTFAARRWVPWLCAYTGARVGEMIQLRKQDVRKEDGHWVVVITPEAVTVKANAFRMVPVHEHLIELGFLDFVKNAPDEFLFLSPQSLTPEGFAGALKSGKTRVTEFVREVLTDPNVQPNHGWRHRFLTVRIGLGIDEKVAFAITGHSMGAEGRKYGSVPLKDKGAAIAKLPRYEILPKVS